MLPEPVYVVDELFLVVVLDVVDVELPFPVARPTRSFAPKTVVVQPKIKTAAQRIVTSLVILLVLFIAVISPFITYGLPRPLHTAGRIRPSYVT